MNIFAKYNYINPVHIKIKTRKNTVIWVDKK